MTFRKKLRIKFASVIVLAVVVGLISYPKAVSFSPRFYNELNKLKINLGLDLQGGIHLEYKADVSKIDPAKVDDAMQALQDAIERRVNAFGVAEPTVYTTKSGSDRRLVVELAGVKNIDQAKAMIKATPFLEFKEEGQSNTSNQIPQNVLDQMNQQQQQQAQQVLKQALTPGADFSALAKQYSQDPGSKDKGGDLGFVKKGTLVPEYDNILFNSSVKDGEVYPQVVESQYGWSIIKKIQTKGTGANEEVDAAHILFAKKTNPTPEPTFVSTGLTGKNLKNASVEFSNQGVSSPEIAIQFDAQGTKLFAEITKENIGKPLAIYLDGQLLSAPTVQTEIDNGQAVITGDFTLDEAKTMVQNLNEGALPVPINLVSQESVDASLGSLSLHQSLVAGIVGLAVVMIFMIFYYRFLGVIAAVALLIYTGIMISIFKISTVTPWSMTLTLPGIAGFILSIGMAVDANILIFERTKEEVRRGRTMASAIEEGFKRAWTSIRDGNLSSIITSLILIEIGTGFVKGFAVTLIVGVLVSMFTAVTISRTLLQFLLREKMHDKLWLIGVKQTDVKSDK